jgi:hypothetical protein
VKQERFRFGIHPHTGRVRDLLRRDFEAQWESTNGHEHCRRCLDFTCEKYRVDDWREFVPQRLHSHVPGRLPHQTTITDTFNRTNSSTLGTSSQGTWSWLDTFGAQFGGDWWNVASNECKANTGMDVRAETDLSGDDHYAQVLKVAAANGSFSRHGTAVRFSSSARTYYAGQARSDNFRIHKVVAGTETAIAGPSGVGSGNGTTIKTEANGSDVAFYSAGVSVLSVTDTAITGNLRTGLYNASTDAGDTYDSFEAADLAAPPTAIPHRLLLLGVGA